MNTDQTHQMILELHQLEMARLDGLLERVRFVEKDYLAIIASLDKRIIKK